MNKTSNNKLLLTEPVVFCKMIFVCVLCILLGTANASGANELQQRKVTLNMQSQSIKNILSNIQKQTGINFAYNENELSSYTRKNIRVEEEEVEKTLATLLSGTDLTYSMDGNTVTIYKKKEQSRTTLETRVVRGRIMDLGGNPIAGASVVIKGTIIGTSSDGEGHYELRHMESPNAVIQVSFIGMKSFETVVKDRNVIDVRLEEESVAMDDVVVTGIYSRKKESFTGSSQTYNGKLLKTIGNQNVLQSLRSLDPAFNILENNEFGSDPNRLPDMEIRGKTSIVGLDQEFTTDPNQPLFILDGFESDLRTISDLSMDRVENITILKDASATAIYGSKAANGVIVVETKAPATGSLRISYNANLILSVADLSDYNLMNASEKLLFEKLSGYYGKLDENGDILKENEALKYNQRKAEVARGVDTYWLKVPLKNGISHRHTLFAEGGDSHMRYGVGFNYGKTNGVMKGSGRETINGNVRLIYRRKNIAFTDYLNIDYYNSSESNVGFSRFAQTNPYYRKNSEDGSIQKILERHVDPIFGLTEYTYNPEYDRQLGSFNRTSSAGFKNNFEIDWTILTGLKARGRFSVSRYNIRNEVFKSPNHSDFADTDPLKKGSYNELNTRKLSFDGDVNVTYVFESERGHVLNAVAGFRAQEDSHLESGYSAYGFIDDSYSNPAFSTGYPEDQRKPKYKEYTSRSVSYYLNGGYSYKNRYLLDFNVRNDGSSVFGSNKKFTSTWAVGIAWNLHNEAFVKNAEWLSMLKLRASVGNPGNQNFDPYMAMRTYRYNNSLQNPFGLSTLIDVFGNSDLKWQKTIDKNIGTDITILDNKIKLSLDVFQKDTDPLLVYISVPSSTGSRKTPRNIGKLESFGVTVALNAVVLSSQDFNWALNVNGRHMKSEYRNVDQALSDMNEQNRSRNLTRYYNGGTPTALWTVRSEGIDPSSGREIFVKADGSRSFVYDYNDETVVGDGNPDLEGVFGTTLRYKGFSASLSFRYKFGGEIFAYALYNKVENISKTSVRNNQDARALHDRWQASGNRTKFKSISLTETTPMSSRFVVKDNVISCESISFGYETQSAKLRRIGASSMNVRAYMNDIFRRAAMKNERGIEYPFARSVSFSLGITF